jgi:hypothetical protein
VYVRIYDERGRATALDPASAEAKAALEAASLLLEGLADVRKLQGNRPEDR